MKFKDHVRGRTKDGKIVEGAYEMTCDVNGEVCIYALDGQRYWVLPDTVELLETRESMRERM